MKKLILAVGIGIVIIVGALIFMQNVNFNRIGTDKYYTQINGEGSKMEDKGSNGVVYVRYEYELPAYDQDGDKKTLTFTSEKQLREKAYLLLYTKSGKGVTSYQEIPAKELPEKAAKMLK
ncbi:YxeA family protein [Pseudobacillus sp. FSL P4-0506]|uniref:YxeA family protein n=1 Tax=Pseudobacillus sp. FSL P4-0506 TaxID=2921576 RepID=UPI0030F96CF4